jgi:hypothetical protein
MLESDSFASLEEADEESSGQRFHSFLLDASIG